MSLHLHLQVGASLCDAFDRAAALPTPKWSEARRAARRKARAALDGKQQTLLNLRHLLAVVQQQLIDHAYDNDNEDAANALFQVAEFLEPAINVLATATEADALEVAA
jgi:hypothetical protein